MKVAAVIAEYNPFHNGHQYQLNTIKESLGADRIIIIMSGNFTQRGIPAIVDKYQRCRMALECGADVVIELPAYFALGSAEYFAQGAVSLIDKLGVVDILHFGSECGDIDNIKRIASILSSESPSYKAALNQYLKEGLSFPAARQKAIKNEMPDNIELASVLDNPNNNLGIEYVKALLQRKSSIVPRTLERKGSSYNSGTIDSDNLASAQAIRNLLSESSSDADVSILKNHLPENVAKLLIANNAEYMYLDDFSSVLYYKLISELAFNSSLCKYYDVNKQISDIYVKNLSDYTTFSEYCMSGKSKNYTYTRLCRGLMHILLDMTQENVDVYKENDYTQYARLLGFRKSSSDVLSAIKANSNIPLITKLPNALKSLEGAALSSLEADIHASKIYYGIQGQKYHHAPLNEYTKEIVII